MKSPKDIQAWAKARFKNQKRRWLDGHGCWPLSVPLDKPTQHAAIKRFMAVRAWSGSWTEWRQQAQLAQAPTPELVTATVNWPDIGPQTLPVQLVFDTPEIMADYCADGDQWRRAVRRRAAMLERWPSLATCGVGVHYESLATYSDRDFSRLLDLLDWLAANPRSGLYLRQLPVPGIDTKWVDKHRRRIVADLLKRIRAVVRAEDPLEGPEVDAELDEPAEDDEKDEGAGDFYEVCGLRKPSPRVRMLVLCPMLRMATGGLRDIEAPVEELAALNLSPKAVVVVENKDTGLCLPDIPGVVAVIKLGNAVSLAQRLMWLAQLPVLYWGDVDTHGYSILTHARRSLGNVRSVLMDEPTVLGHLDRLVDEPKQSRRVDPELLHPTELKVYERLIGGDWGPSVRLEQERLTWPTALQQVLLALQSDRSSTG
jgi:hypothetical protein